MINANELSACEGQPAEVTATDYGGYHLSHYKFTPFRLTELNQLKVSVLQANSRGTAIRVRGNAHSMNGLALPRSGELLIETGDCDHFSFSEPGAVTVGSGAAIWDVNEMLAEHGYELLVFNDGGQAASTVGGYLSAGGFGAKSDIYGGFWESVLAVTMVTGDGRDLVVGYGDDLFPWLFGSMGQLGVFFEVCLGIQPKSDQEEKYLLGLRGRITKSQGAIDWPRILWYTLFVPKADEEQALSELSEIAVRHQSMWRERSPYRYDVAFHRFNPPLISTQQTSLVAVGVWGTAPTDDGFDFEQVRRLECDIRELLAKRPRYHRYVQTELMFDDFDLRGHFGAEIYDQFVAHKRALDPNGLMGRGLLPAFLS